MLLMLPGTDPRTTSQARPRRTAASEVARKNRILSKISEKQVPKQGLKEQVSCQTRFPSKFRRNRIPRNRFASKVFKDRCPGKVPRIVNRILQSLIFFLATVRRVCRSTIVLVKENDAAPAMDKRA